MKKLLIVILLLVSSISYSQFKTDVSAGYGLSLQNSDNAYMEQFGFSLTPSYTHKKFNFGLQTYVVFNSVQFLPQVFTGVKISYPVYYNDGNPLSVSARWLYASQGAQLFGGGINYAINKDFSVGLDLSQNYLSKQFYGELNINYSLIK